MQTGLLQTGPMGRESVRLVLFRLCCFKFHQELVCFLPKSHGLSSQLLLHFQTGLVGRENVRLVLFKQVVSRIGLLSSYAPWAFLTFFCLLCISRKREEDAWVVFALRLVYI